MNLYLLIFESEGTNLSFVDCDLLQELANLLCKPIDLYLVSLFEGSLLLVLLLKYNLELFLACDLELFVAIVAYPLSLCQLFFYLCDIGFSLEKLVSNLDVARLEPLYFCLQDDNLQIFSTVFSYEALVLVRINATLICAGSVLFNVNVKSVDLLVELTNFLVFGEYVFFVLLFLQLDVFDMFSVARYGLSQGFNFSFVVFMRASCWGFGFVDVLQIDYAILGLNKFVLVLLRPAQVDGQFLFQFLELSIVGLSWDTGLDYHS